MCTPKYENLAFYIQNVTSSYPLDYILTSTIPSNSLGKRVWSFTASGRARSRNFDIVLDFQNVPPDCSYNFSFERPLQGTIQFGNHDTLSASKYMTYFYTRTQPLILSLNICIPKKYYEPDIEFDFSIFIKEMD